MAQGNSAARVFAIAELLETILLFVGLDNYNGSANRKFCIMPLLEPAHTHSRCIVFGPGSGFYQLFQDDRIPMPLDVVHQPPLQLFTLQRINATFRDVVRGSGKLRQLMGLHSHEAVLLGRGHAPLIWLLRKLGYSGFEVCDPASCETQCQTIDTRGSYVKGQDHRDSLEMACCKEASWRKMVVAPVVLKGYAGQDEFVTHKRMTLGSAYDELVKAPKMWRSLE